MHHDYKLHEALNDQMRFMSGTGSAVMDMFARNARLMGLRSLGDHYAAAAAVLEYGAKTYSKPEFGITSTTINGEHVGVRETVSSHRAFGNAVTFERDTRRNDPNLLVVAPMSGHFATLLRGTVKELLPQHNVTITDWTNAKDVPLSSGRFDLADYADYIRGFLNDMGPNTHVLAVCQAAVPAVAATAIMAEANDPCQPLSLAIMGAPIDTRINPTDVNRFADRHALATIRQHAISTVTDRHVGHGRPVLPGFRQLNNFLGMNPERHFRTPYDLYKLLVAGDPESLAQAAKKGAFYDEYLATMDMDAAFFLQTYEEVFRKKSLAKGEMVLADQLVNPAHVRKTALMTVEGGKDDICGRGQTEAAHRLFSNLAANRHFAHVEAAAGHYGIFEGSRWRDQIAPRLTHFFRKAGVDNHLNFDEIPSDSRSIPPNFWSSGQGLTKLRLVA